MASVPNEHEIADTVAAVDLWTYPFRRLWWWLRTPESACNVVGCARPIVGFSRYCRDHTDAILRRRTDG